jgi:hypothetical protein
MKTVFVASRSIENWPRNFFQPGRVWRGCMKWRFKCWIQIFVDNKPEYSIKKYRQFFRPPWKEPIVFYFYDLNEAYSPPSHYIAHAWHSKGYMLLGWNDCSQIPIRADKHKAKVFPTVHKCNVMWHLRIVFHICRTLNTLEHPTLFMNEIKYGVSIHWFLAPAWLFYLYYWIKLEWCSENTNPPCMLKSLQV